MEIRLSILICAIHVQYVIMCYYMREEEGIRGGDLLRPGGGWGWPRAGRGGRYPGRGGRGGRERSARLGGQLGCGHLSDIWEPTGVWHANRLMSLFKCKFAGGDH